MGTDLATHGIYNIEYFSGSQVAVYIGDIWVDEITSMSYAVQQRKTPLYGYADTLYRTVTKGQVLVQGSFTINFKEAGYLWLVLDHYNKMRNVPSKLNPFNKTGNPDRRNIEAFIDGETSNYGDRNQLLSNIAAQAALTGFASNNRLVGTTVSDSTSPEEVDFIKQNQGGSLFGHAEDLFEAFEDRVWSQSNQELDEQHRRADDPTLNNFDIYVAFGDFAGDNRNNHTIQKLTNVHIIGSSKQIEVSGMPIQEQYDFIARNLV